MSKIAKYVKRELAIQPVLKAGYSRSTATKWYGRCKDDVRYWHKSWDANTIQAAHDSGFLISSIKRYSIDDFNNTDYISDLDYLSLQPFNNSFTKWIEDIYTASRVLIDHPDVMRKVYFSIIQRNGKQIILPNGGADREYTVDDIADLIKEKGKLELRPAFWSSKKKRYLLDYDGTFFSVNEEPIPNSYLSKIIGGLNAYYIVADPVSISFKEIDQVSYDHVIRLWIANDYQREPEVLTAVMSLYWDGENGERMNESVLMDLSSGTYSFEGEEFTIPGWDKIIAKVKSVSKSIRQINFFTMSIALDGDGSFKIVYLDGSPKRPSIPYNTELDTYLKSKLRIGQFSRSEYTKELFRKVKNKIKHKLMMRKARPGIRPYMQKLWESAIRDDMRNTKGASRSQKRWMHEHGFYSYRIWQYGVNKENYKDFLSDYDYYWLNRINNDYQKWVNDKTTYRMIMEPLKEYVPKYYLSVFRVGGEPVISRQFDLPEHISEDFRGFLQLLREEKILAFKPSAGTHGDGFYCLEYREDSFWVNGEAKTEDEMRDIVLGQKSFYVLTEYISMHDDLKKIYAKSVNTVRVVVVNSHGYDPKIMQQYIRIGSLRTGFTDNVGYGGICAMIDNDTGEIYQPQSIKAHYFYDCPVHPDTGTVISGKLPNWDLMCEGILRISRYLGELEYLGYDVAVTNDGMEVLEINIHPDLHKVADFSDEFKEFFVKQKERKARANKINL